MMHSRIYFILKRLFDIAVIVEYIVIIGTLIAILTSFTLPNWLLALDVLTTAAFLGIWVAGVIVEVKEDVRNRHILNSVKNKVRTNDDK